MALNVVPVRKGFVPQEFSVGTVGNEERREFGEKRFRVFGKAGVVYVLLVLFLLSAIAVGYAHWLGNGIGPFIYRKPAVAALFNRRVLSLKPFIIPAGSEGKAYRIISVDLTVDSERGDLVLSHLPELRHEIYGHLLHGGGAVSDHYSRFNTVVRNVNLKIGSSVVREIWINRVKLL